MPRTKKYSDASVYVSKAALAKLHASVTPEEGEPEWVKIEGKCPRCAHAVEYFVPQKGWGLDGGAGGAGAASASVHTESAEAVQRVPVDDDTLRKELEEFLKAHSPPGKRDVALHCNCAKQHAKDKKGCGAWFSLHIRWNPDAEGKLHVPPLTRGPEVTVRQQEAAEERDQLAQSELSRLRSAAGNWRTGLAALLVLIPTLVVVKGADSVAKLSNHDKRIVGVLIVIGAVAAVLAALFAMRAAFGPLSRSDTGSDDLTLVRDREVGTTIAYLWWVLGLTLVAAAALAGAIGWAWQAPETAPAKFSVTLIDDGVVCGTYVGRSTTQVTVENAKVKPKKIKVKTSDGSVAAIPLSKVKAAAFTSSC